MTLNVCGINRRLQYPDFLELVNKFNILCFVETKTDDVDEIEIPGFTVKMKNRFKFRKIKSGGIILAVRNNLTNYIFEIESESKYVFWFKADKRLFRLNQDIVFGIVYIPP